MARPKLDTPKKFFNFQELAAAYGIALHVLTMLSNLGLLPEASGPGGKGSARLWTDYGIMFAGICSALQSVGFTLTQSSRIASALIEILNPSPGRIVNVARIIERAEYYVEDSIVGCIREHVESEQNLSGYLEGDSFVEIIDKSIVLHTGGSFDDVSFVCSITEWADNGEIEVSTDSAEYPPSSVETISANALGVVRVNLSLATRRAFIRIIERRTASTAEV